MSNYQVEPANKPQALTTEAIKALRHEQVQGVSRRELLRGSLFAGIGLWLVEVTAGSLGMLWPNLEGRFGGEVKIGTLDEIKSQNSDLPRLAGWWLQSPPPSVLNGSLPTPEMRLPSATNLPPCPFAQKPRSSSVMSTVMVKLS